MEYTILSNEIYLENEILNGSIIVKDNKIDKISNDNLNIGETISLIGLKVFPGFLDIHVHGGNGFDTMDGSYESINELSKFKLLEGVTSFCPTTVTSSMDKTTNAIKSVSTAIKNGVDGSKIIGTFLEGPFISKKYKGAHPEEFIEDIKPDLIQLFLDIGQGSIKSIAIAPELDYAYETIEQLVEKNINIRIGHTAATSEQAELSIKHGSNIAIHTFNAMSPFNHREAGTVGAILNNNDIYNEIICDLVHVNKTAIQILVKCKKEKIILITDCMSAGGLEDGNFILGELDVIVKDSIARLKDNTLAGSTLSLMKAVYNMNKTVGIDLIDVVKMASLNPAKALNMDNEIGSIKEGKKADIIAIDEYFNLKFVMIEGKILFKSI